MRYFLIIMVMSLLAQAANAQRSDFKGVTFKEADSIAALYPGYSLRNLKDLADKLTIPLNTDVEKFRAIYTWVSNNISSDYDAYNAHKYKRKKLSNQPEKLAEWNDRLLPSMFKRLLNEQKTVCTGYAYLIQELSIHAGIKCEIINGFGKSTDFDKSESNLPNHSWNAARINGKWYLCDATWSSGIFDKTNKQFVSRFEDTYFLTAPELFLLTHYPMDIEWALISTTLTRYEFLNSPFIYKTAAKYGIQPIMPEVMETVIKKGDSISVIFRMEDKQIANSIRLKIKQKTIKTSVRQIDRNTYSVDYIFNKRGVYPVHIMINDQYAITCAVRVTI